MCIHTSRQSCNEFGLSPALVQTLQLLHVKSQSLRSLRLRQRISGHVRGREPVKRRLAHPVDLVLVASSLAPSQRVVLDEVTQDHEVALDVENAKARHDVLVGSLGRQLDPAVHQGDLVDRVEPRWPSILLADTYVLGAEVFVDVVVDVVLQLDILLPEPLREEPPVPELVADADVAVEAQDPLDVEVLVEVTLFDVLVRVEV